MDSKEMHEMHEMHVGRYTLRAFRSTHLNHSIIYIKYLSSIKAWH